MNFIIKNGELYARSTVINSNSPTLTQAIRRAGLKNGDGILYHEGTCFLSNKALHALGIKRVEKLDSFDLPDVKIWPQAITPKNTISLSVRDESTQVSYERFIEEGLNGLLDSLMEMMLEKNATEAKMTVDEWEGEDHLQGLSLLQISWN